MVVINKSQYKRWLTCPRYAWNLYHQKMIEEATIISEDQSQQGYEVENLAQKLFPNGWTVSGQETADYLAETKRLMTDPQAAILYQATALSAANCLARADILTLDHRQRTFDLYEVKSVTNIGFGEKKQPKKQQQFIEDVGFQKLAFIDCPYQLKNIFIIYLNKQFRLQSTFDHQQFFITHQLTQAVDDQLADLKTKIQVALQDCSGAEPSCDCRYKAKIDRCPPEFFEKFNPDIPTKHSIFNISRIHKKKLGQLMDKQILAIDEINQTTLNEIQFSAKQLNQIQVSQTNQKIINKSAIKDILKQLQLPLYFLDYETVSYAVPRFDNSRPHQQIAFQFSLHILEASGQLQHQEYLMTGANNEELNKLLTHLKQAFSQPGSVVVWHQAAEKTFHKNLQDLMPETAGWLADITQCFFDLETIFSQQAYLHPDFNGQTSIKKVLPVILAEAQTQALIKTDDLDYKQLNIQDGQAASVAWKQALLAPEQERQAIFDDLLKYCRLDTLAMVKIYQFLQKLVE